MQEAWSKHRSSAWRYKPAPFKCLAIVAGVGWQMLYVLIITVLLGLYETFARPQGMPSIALDGFGVRYIFHAASAKFSFAKLDTGIGIGGIVKLIHAV